MSGAHKTALRIRNVKAGWVGDVIIYVTDNGKRRLFDLLKEAGLDYGSDRPSITILDDVDSVEETALTDSERMRKHMQQEKESWRV